MISGKISVPAPPGLTHAGTTVPNPREVSDAFADQYAGVSRENPVSPMTNHRRHLEFCGERYNVPLFSLRAKGGFISVK